MSLYWRAAFYVAGFALLAGGAATRQAPALNALTVPSGNLPGGCRLRPLEPRPVLSLPSGLVVLPSNPWSGSDRKLRAAVRMAVDGTLRMPDAPPPDRREMVSFESKWADDVEEAYHAEYVSADGDRVFVSAVRFNDQKWARSESERPAALRDGSTRIVQGARVIRLYGSSRTDCFQAISNYLQSLR